MTNRLKELLDTYKKKIADLFKEDLVGIYLTGSVAFNDFIEGKSDVDCTVLLKLPLDIDKLEAVKSIHQDISSHYRNICMESQYLSCDNLGDADSQPYYSYHDNKISLGKFNSHAVTWFSLKKHGVTITGTPADVLNISTSVYEVKSFVKSNANSYWKYWLDTARKSFTAKRVLALTNWAIEWCVCGITRMYYTMMEGDIVSKRKAVEYGLTHLPEATHKILKEALRIRKCEKNGLYSSRFKRRKEMLDYMDYIINEINKLPTEQ